jgi:hypothetical protein
VASGSVHIREAESADWSAIWPFFGEIVGTVPEAFHHPERGYVGLHVMHRRL